MSGKTWLVVIALLLIMVVPAQFASGIVLFFQQAGVFVSTLFQGGVAYAKPVPPATTPSVVDPTPLPTVTVPAPTKTVYVPQPHGQREEGK
ncbi:MAG: hypothetical protein K0S68_669 [Candidatus Saccharibacteria bacterium]|jgi:hypothetical protein|nr:hypothetical protein [Candidatus Saccharibacteria bacterium]